MAKTYPDGFGKGMFIETTPIFDVQDLTEAGIEDEKLRELLVQLRNRVSEINNTINFKTTGIYAEEEFVNGNRFYKPAATATTRTTSRPFAQSFVKFVNFGALPNAGGGLNDKKVAHGINVTGSNFMFTRIICTATDPTAPSSISIPYIDVSGTIATDIELYIDGTDVVISANGADLSSYTNTGVILEYVKY